MLDLVKPPTDNLYKFMAVAGVVLFVLGLIYAPYVFYRSTVEALKSRQAKAELDVHRQFAETRHKTLDARKQQVEAERVKLQKRIDELLNSKNSNPTLSGEVDRLETRIRETKAAAEALADAEHELNLNLELKAAQAEHQRTVSVNESRNARLVVRLGFVVAYLGVVLAAAGFTLWYIRVMRFQDELLERQAKVGRPALTSGATDASE